MGDWPSTMLMMDSVTSRPAEGAPDQGEEQEHPRAKALRRKERDFFASRRLCVFAPLREKLLLCAEFLHSGGLEVFLLIALMVAGACCVSCNDRPDHVRVEHKSASKTPEVFNDGELAGRVVFAAGGQGVPASGANILVVDTEEGKQLLEHLQHETDPSCVKRLTEMETFLLESAQSSARAGQKLPTGTADTDGYFLLPRVKPGAYLVVAYGRAGDTQAIWEQPAMVEQFQAVMVKMVEPLISCPANEENSRPSRRLPLASPPAQPSTPQP